MLLTTAEKLANDLLNEHGLHDWTFEFDRAKRRFGYCSYKRKTISLSKHLVALNSEADVRDTILHEIAHALVGSNNGHNYKWRSMCITVGAKPERCYVDDEVVKPKHNYEGVCPNCGYTITRMRLKTAARDLACNLCCDKYNDGHWSEEFVLDWHSINQTTTSKFTPEFVDTLPSEGTYHG